MEPDGAPELCEQRAGALRTAGAASTPRLRELAAAGGPQRCGPRRRRATSRAQRARSPCAGPPDDPGDAIETLTREVGAHARAPASHSWRRRLWLHLELGGAEGGYEEGEAENAFPELSDGRDVPARSRCEPTAAPFDESGRPRRSPCPRLCLSSLRPSQCALGRLTPGWAWCRRSERWRGCLGRLRPSLRHAGGRCGGTQSALGCATGRRLRASSARIRCWAGRGRAGTSSRRRSRNGQRRGLAPRPTRAASRPGCRACRGAATSRPSMRQLPMACQLSFCAVSCQQRPTA